MVRVTDLADLRFTMRDVFPADDALAVYVMALSIALGDIRIAAKYAVREEQLDYERVYFVRLLTAHVREAAKLAVLDHRDRDDVRRFVAGLPEEAQDARARVEEILEEETRAETTLFADVKRIRDDTFHYARDEQSQARLRKAMERVAGAESGYLLGDRASETHSRALYADLVAVNAMHPFGKTEEEILGLSRAMHGRIVGVLDPLGSFIQHAESSWIRSRPDVTRND